MLWVRCSPVRESLSQPARAAPARGRFAIQRAAPENLRHSAANLFAAPASFESHRPEPVPALNQFDPDTELPASQTVPPPPAVRDLAASLRHCPLEWSWSLPPHAQSALASPSQPILEWSDVPPTNSACIPTAPRVAPGLQNGQARCPRAPQLACLQDPELKKPTRYP